MDTWQLLWEFYLRTDLLIVQLPTAGLTGGILPLAVSCFPAFWSSLVWLPAPTEIQGSREHSQPLRSHSGPSQGWVHRFQGLLQQPECTAEVRELQSHFKQRSSESHYTTPPADFNRCPTSFKRDHYQRSTTPVVTTLIFKSASLSRCCPCCVGITLSLTC